MHSERKLPTMQTRKLLQQLRELGNMCAPDSLLPAVLAHLGLEEVSALELQTTEYVLSAMNLKSLEDHCQHEIMNYRKGEQFNDRYSLEIFYRAINKQDEQAWEVLMRTFRGMVVGWLRRHPHYDSAMCYASEEHYVDLAFARFWKTTASP